MTRFSKLSLAVAIGLSGLAGIGSSIQAADDKSAIDFVPGAQKSVDIGPQREVIRERFPDGRVRIEREVIQDDEDNYLNHGYWKMADRQGNKVAEGMYRHGRRHGKWTAWFFSAESPLFKQAPYNQFPGPFISQADFNDGRLDGVWTVYDAKQRRISQWSYSDGQRQGKWTWWYPNGKKFRELTYDNGDISGQVTVWNAEGQATLVDAYEDGRQLSKQVESFENGRRKSEGTFLVAQRVQQTSDDWWNATLAKEVVVGRDEKHGTWLSWYPNGQKKMEGQYSHDSQSGKFRWWHSNGQLSISGEFVDGQKHGKWTWWHPSGQKASQGNYRDGSQEGKWTFWGTDGRVTQRADFSDPSVRVAQSAADDKATSTEESPKANDPITISR